MASSRRLRIPNPRLSTSEITQLDSDYSTGASLTVLSNLGFSAQDIVVVGQMGDDQTEQKDVSALLGNTGITLSGALKFPHQKQTPIQKSSWNQISIERQYTSTGSWTVLITTDIQWDKLDTLYIDSGSSDQYNYRFRFLNSVSNNFSDYSPTISGGGTAVNEVGRMIINVRRKVRDPNRNRVSDERIIQLFQEGQDVIKGIRYDWWFLKVDTYQMAQRGLATGISTIGSQNYYSLENYSDLNYLHRVRYLYNSNTNNQLYDLTPKDEEEFDRYQQNQSVPPNNNSLFFKIAPPDSLSATGYFVVFPIPSDNTGIFYPIYYKNLNVLSDISDTTNVPYPQILEDYAAWMIHKDLKNEGEAGLYQGLFFGPPVTPYRGATNLRFVTGLALLEQENRFKQRATNQPKVMWKWNGRGRGKNYYGNGTPNHDYIKENFI